MMVYPTKDQWTSAQLQFLEHLTTEIISLQGQIATLQTKLQKILASHQESIHE